MTEEKRRWPLEFATMVADILKGHLTPFCKRIEVAGSIRRRKAMVGDIELLAIPDVIPLHNLLGEVTELLDTLDQGIKRLIEAGFLAYRLNQVGGRLSYGPKNKYLVHVPSGMPVDVFCTTEERWGMALFVRTGPAEWNIKAMSQLRQLGMRGEAYGGVVDEKGRRHDCPDEESVFRFLGWPFVPPEQRV